MPVGLADINKKKIVLRAVLPAVDLLLFSLFHLFTIITINYFLARFHVSWHSANIQFLRVFILVKIHFIHLLDLSFNPLS